MTLSIDDIILLGTILLFNDLNIIMKEIGQRRGGHKDSGKKFIGYT